MLQTLSPTIRTVVKVKEKWLGLKVMTKKRDCTTQKKHQCHRRGQSATSVSSKDDRKATVTGETSMKGIRQPQSRLDLHKVQSHSFYYFFCSITTFKTKVL